MRRFEYRQEKRLFLSVLTMISLNFSENREKDISQKLMLFYVLIRNMLSNHCKIAGGSCNVRRKLVDDAAICPWFSTGSGV